MTRGAPEFPVGDLAIHLASFGDPVGQYALGLNPAPDVGPLVIPFLGPFVKMLLPCWPLVVTLPLGSGAPLANLLDQVWSLQKSVLFLHYHSTDSVPSPSGSTPDGGLLSVVQEAT